MMGELKLDYLREAVSTLDEYIESTLAGEPSDRGTTMLTESMAFSLLSIAQSLHIVSERKSRG